MTDSQESSLVEDDRLTDIEQSVRKFFTKGQVSTRHWAALIGDFKITSYKMLTFQDACTFSVVKPSILVDNLYLVSILYTY